MTNKVLFTLTALPLLMTEPLAARTIFPAMGYAGPLGSTWDEHCPQNKFLVGLQVRATPEAIRLVRIVCASMNVSGRHGALWYGKVIPPLAPLQEFSCPRDAVVMGLDARTGKSGSFETPRVVKVTALCVSRASGTRTQVTWGEGASTPSAAGAAVFSQACPAGESGSGFNGRSHKAWLAGIGLDCAVRLPS